MSCPINSLDGKIYRLHSADETAGHCLNARLTRRHQTAEQLVRRHNHHSYLLRPFHTGNFYFVS